MALKKKVGLITENNIANSDYINQLNSIFGNALLVSAYSIDTGTAYGPKSESVFLTSAISSKDYSNVKKSIAKGSTLIPFNLCLRRKPLLQLNAYSKGTKALLYNVSKYMAEETIAQIYQSGINNIEFTPLFPDCNYEGDISLVITPGETEHLPDFAKEIIDIGSRLIDIAAIIELAVKLDCEYVLETKGFDEYYEKQFSLSSGTSFVLAKNKQLSQMLSSLVQLNSTGLIGMSATHKIFDCNHKAASYLDSKRADLLNSNADSFIPRPLLERCKAQQVAVLGEIEGKPGARLMLALEPITRGMQYYGAFISITPASFDGKPMVTADPPRKGHAARYHFSDIVGTSTEIRKTIRLAKMMAKTDSSVLITGESGTGKELFAHSIHNGSQRSEGPFVAINCAAIPDNLLESELFGYEEGAFTGAKKGGKAGLFELADTGSIFLDEIEGMSQNLQVKLLRVIQEREIMRVGGDKIIPIDVRIISASNQELQHMTKTGRFRHDLFYRISTLPINLPPLRRRRDDIPLLIEEFKSVLNLTFVLTSDAESLLRRYEWPGNIRELRNYVEYFGCLRLPVIEQADLPAAIQNALCGSLLQATNATDVDAEILNILQQRSCGRKLLAAELIRRGILLNEAQLRKRLEQLKEWGWITSGSGRGGSSITSKGRQELSHRSKPDAFQNDSP